MLYSLISLLFVVSKSSTSNTVETSDTTSALSRAVSFSDNRQPYIPRKFQEIVAQKKLADVKKDNNNQPPNILWIVADDLGYSDVGINFGGGEVFGAATPNLNWMQQNGLSLLNVYSQPTCTPSRAAMMTGRLPKRTGLTRPILTGDTFCVNPWENEDSIAKILSNNGYYTILSGKWHTGEEDGTRPVDVGFDEFMGYYLAARHLSAPYDQRLYPDLVLNQELRQNWIGIGGKHELYYHKKGNDEIIKQKMDSIDKIANADQYAKDFTIEKIKEAKQNNKPFFIIHNFMKIHADTFVNEQYAGSSSSKYPAKDGIVEIDSIVGELLTTLQNEGLDDNTFVFFTSDNGPEYDSWPDCGSTPFKGSKSTTWEGGVRVPGIAYWKNVIQPGRVSTGLFDQMDLFNTAISLAGLNIEEELTNPNDIYIDGIDQTSFLLADDGQSKREQIYYYIQNLFAAVRVREFKMHQYTVEQKDSNFWIDYSYMQKSGLSAWLYNLYIDPKEQKPIGHRLSAWLPTMNTEYGLHEDTFVNYTAKNIGLGVTNCDTFLSDTEPQGDTDTENCDA